MSDDFKNASKEHYTRTWVALLTSAIGAAGLIIAAWIGVDAKHDREEAAAKIAAQESQINELRQGSSVLPAAGTDSTELANQVASLRSALALKDAEIQRLQASRSTNSGSVASPAGETSPSALMAQEEAGIRFELQGCHLSGSEITCSFLLTNTAEDRSITICSPCFGNRSRVVDVNGSEYLGQTATLGQDSGPEPRATLAKGIPIKASITFRRVSPSSGLKLVEVGFRARGEYEVQFHDVPFSG